MFVSKLALQIVPLVITPASCCVHVCMCMLPVCVNACSVLLQHFEKINHMKSNISSQRVQVSFFFSLTLIVIFIFISFAYCKICCYLANCEKELILILPLDSRSDICNRKTPMRILYIIILTYIFKVAHFEIW